MPSIASERMSRVDTAWLRMDNEVNLMMIVGVWLLQPGARATKRCASASPTSCCSYDRFRQKVVQDAVGAIWVDDADFDIHHHVVREKLVRRKGHERTRGAAGAVRQAGDAAARPKRPLWQFHLIERYEGGSALIVRIHHCIGDGIALISVVHVDHRRRQRSAVAQARRDADDAAEGDWLVRLGDQAAHRHRGQGAGHDGRGRGAIGRGAVAPAAAARVAGDGARGLPGARRRRPRWR